MFIPAGHVRPVYLVTARNTVARNRNMETPAGGMPTACVVQFISFSACVVLTFLLETPVCFVSFMKFCLILGFVLIVFSRS